MRTTPILVSAAAIAALSLAGCGGASDAEPSASAPRSATASASPTPTETAQPSPSTTATPGGACTAADLAVTQQTGDAGAGSVTVTFTFEDTGAEPCTLAGFPSVSAVGGGDGEQIGAPADRSDAAYDAVDLQPGGTATAAMRMVNVGADGGPIGADCDVQPADGWRIDAPDSTEAIFVPVDGLTACAGDVGWLTIEPIVA